MSSSDDEEVRQIDMERAFAVLDLPYMLGTGSVDMYTQAVRELGSIFCNTIFWTQASRNLMASVVDCAMQAIDACQFDNQRCLGALNGMMNAASKQKALQKTKRSKIFASFRTAGIMHSRRRKKRDNVFDVSLDLLPPEVLAIVFGHLDPKSLLQCMLVCKEWKETILFYDDHIWRRHLRIAFGDAKAQSVCTDQSAFKTFSAYAFQFPFMLIPYQTKRIAIQGFVRTVNPNTWNRLISQDRRNDHGIALKSAKYPRMPLFLLPDEVVFWLNRPYKDTLMALAHQWTLLEDRVIQSQGESGHRQHCRGNHQGGRFWQ